MPRLRQKYDGLGGKLRKKRLDLGMGLREAASIIGCSHFTVDAIEKGSAFHPLFLPGIKRLLSKRAKGRAHV